MALIATPPFAAMRPLPRPLRLLVEVLLIIGVSEGVVMGVMPFIAPGLAPLQESLLDVALLLLLATPMLYWRSMAFTRATLAAPPYTAPASAGGFSFRQAVAWTCAVHVLGLALTAAGLFVLYRDLQSEAANNFDHETERLEAEIYRRFQKIAYGLGGLRANLASAQVAQLAVPLPREAFAAHVAARNLREEFAGVRGFGFIERVARSETTAFERRMQADGAAQFRVRSTGDASEMLVIRNIEPLAQNREALGFDVAQEITRRTAARRAIYSGALSMTGSVTLVQDAARSPGFLLFLPAYREGQSPYQPDGQPATLVGLLYAPVVAGELLGSVRQATQSHLDFDLFDGSSTEEGDRVYADRLPHQDTAPAPRSAQRTLKVGGRLLTLSTRSTPAFDALQDRSSLAIAGVGGAGLSLLAALATWLLAAGQLRAQNLARRMTHDLDRLARVVQHTHNAVAITDADGVIAWVNAGFSRILGYDGDRVRGSSLLSYVSTHDSDQGTLRELLQQVQRGTAARGELRLRCQDGSNVWMDTELQPVLDAQGTVTGFMAIATDITQQKQAQLQMEAAMREASTLLTTFEAHAIVSVTDRSGTITQVNDAFCAISGYSAEESLGANHRIVNSGTHPAAFWEAMWADIAAGQSWRADVCNRAKDGRLYWVDSIITPFVGDDGLVERYVSIRNDITPRKTAELRLREMSERMALAIEGSSDGVWDWMDVSASAQWWSPS